MSTTSTAHARLAALIRHRGEHDPAVLAARVELAQACAGGSIRRSVAYLPPATRRRLLDVLDAATETRGGRAA